MTTYAGEQTTLETCLHVHVFATPSSSCIVKYFNMHKREVHAEGVVYNTHRVSTPLYFITTLLRLSLTDRFEHSPTTQLPISIASLEYLCNYHTKYRLQP